MKTSGEPVTALAEPVPVGSKTLKMEETKAI
jgi:hypothetical protein